MVWPYSKAWNIFSILCFPSEANRAKQDQYRLPFTCRKKDERLRWLLQVESLKLFKACSLKDRKVASSNPAPTIWRNIVKQEVVKITSYYFVRLTVCPNWDFINWILPPHINNETPKETRWNNFATFWLHSIILFLSRSYLCREMSVLVLNLTSTTRRQWTV